MRVLIFWVLVLGALPAVASELTFDLGTASTNGLPAGFRSVLAGRGKPGGWKIVEEEVPPALAPLTAKSPVVTTRAVLGQTARDPVANHFPMLVYDGDVFGDFTFTTRFKITGGALDQMAGVVFRFQNESNFFCVFADAQGGQFRCYKVVNGVATPPLGTETPVEKNVWHDLTVQCEGPRVTGWLDGKDLVKLSDAAGAGQLGKVGLWTKSDTVALFTGAGIKFTPHQAQGQALVSDAVREYSRLLGLSIFAVRPGEKTATVIASNNPKEIGQPGGKEELDVITNGHSYYKKSRQAVTVTLPLHDHNGEPIGAARVVMKTFIGQTEDNAVVRAKPVLKKMEEQVTCLADLLQ